MHRAGLRAGRPAPAARVHARRSTSRRRRRWRSSSPTCRRRSRTRSRSRAAAAFEFALGKSRLPEFPTPDGESIEDYLRGAGARRARGAPGRALSRRPRRARRSAALPRAARVRAEDHHPDGLRGLLPDRRRLHQLGEDATACRSGPGRGSGAGSLVAYSLGITDLDPLRYDLLFERFLNPERVSMPDFDIDFCQDGRDRVIDYVKDEVRRASASRRSPPSAPWRRRRWCATWAACSTCPTARCDRIAKLIPFELGITLEQGARGRAAAEGADEGAGGGGRADGARAVARGPHAQRRHARRRRADRARASSPTSRRSTAPRARPRW